MSDVSVNPESGNNINIDTQTTSYTAVNGENANHFVVSASQVVSTPANTPIEAQYIPVNTPAGFSGANVQAIVNELAQRLPVATDASNDKILAVVGGNYALIDNTGSDTLLGLTDVPAGSGLLKRDGDSIVYDQSVYLSADELGNFDEFAALTSEDEGKVLGVNSSGELQMIAQAAGSGSITAATDNILGGMLLGYQASNDEKNYAVRLDNENRAYVSVPWVAGSGGGSGQSFGIANNLSAGVVQLGFTNVDTDLLPLQVDGSGRAYVDANGVSGGGGGSSTYGGLTEATTAGVTFDTTAFSAGTVLKVSAIGQAYYFDQYPATANTTIYAKAGQTIGFDLSALGGSHPFSLQTSGGSYVQDGLIHVATDGTILEEIAAQGQTGGTLYWKVPSDVSGSFKYQCLSHVGMNGTLDVEVALGGSGGESNIVDLLDVTGQSGIVTVNTSNDTTTVSFEDPLPFTKSVGSDATTITFNNGQNVSLPHGIDAGIKPIYADDVAGANASFIQESRKFINFYPWTGTEPSVVPSVQGLNFKLFVTENGVSAGVKPVYADGVNGANKSFSQGNRDYVYFWPWTGTEPDLDAIIGVNFVQFKGVSISTSVQATKTVVTINDQPPIDIPHGINGIDHGVKVIYATDANGSGANFTQASRKFVGFYPWSNNEPSELPADLSGVSFAKFVGDDGVATDGTDHGVKVIYAEDANGTNASFTQGTKEFINFYPWSDTVPSQVPSGLTYTKFVGDDGVATDGTDHGVTPIYADDANGTNANLVLQSGQKFVNFYPWSGTAPSTVPGCLTYTQFVGSDGTNATPLPDYSSVTEGYVLKVNADNNLVWGADAQGSGGTGSTTFFGLTDTPATAPTGDSYLFYDVSESSFSFADVKQNLTDFTELGSIANDNTDDNKFLGVQNNTLGLYTVLSGAASDAVLGGIKTGYTTENQNYAVDLDADNEAFVNVPWVNTDSLVALTDVDGESGFVKVTTTDGTTTVSFESVTPISADDVDTHLNNPSNSRADDNYVLSWNGSAYAWVAQASGGGGGSVGSFTFGEDTIDTTNSDPITIVPDTTVQGTITANTLTSNADGVANIQAPTSFEITAPDGVRLNNVPTPVAGGVLTLGSTPTWRGSSEIIGVNLQDNIYKLSLNTSYNNPETDYDVSATVNDTNLFSTYNLNISKLADEIQITIADATLNAITSGTIVLFIYEF